VLAALWRRKWIIVLCTAAGLIVALLYTSRQIEQYSASSQVLISGRASDQVVDQSGNQSVQEVNRQLENELSFIRSDATREEVTERLGFAPRVVASRSLDSDTITFKATGTDPTRVALAANTAAEVYVDLRAQRVIDDYLETAAVVQGQLDEAFEERDALTEPVETFRLSMDPNEVDLFGQPVNTPAEVMMYEAELERLEADVAGDLARLDATIATLENTLGQLELTGRLLEEGTAEVTQTARVPSEPFSPDVTKNLLMGLAAGLVLGLALALALEFIDQTLRSKEDVEQVTNLPVLAVIPRARGWRHKADPFLATAEDSFSPAAESYRTLRTSIEFLSIDHAKPRVLITSPEPSAGKSATVANLGVSLANAGHRVVVVDCDLRKPRLHAFFDVDPAVGFTSVVMGKASASEATVDIESIPGLSVIPSGPIPQFPAELLLGQRARTFIEHLRTQYDYVLIDSPPVLAVSDALVLARNVELVVLIARARGTTAGTLAQTAEMLAALDAPMAGAVLNCVRLSRSRGYGYGYGNKRYGGEGVDVPAVEMPSERRPDRHNLGSGDEPDVLDPASSTPAAG
jgi:capsular exopolysaccharide synthesis family protein